MEEHMRMWLCDPKILCNKHLLGEHVEMHMFIGTLRKGIKIDGYLRNNLFEPAMLYVRHNELSYEMRQRDFEHKSEITSHQFMQQFSKLSSDKQWHKINKCSAVSDLISRCPSCFSNYLKLISNKIKTSEAGCVK